MTREEQIRDALKVLKPPSKELDEWKAIVEHAIDVVSARARVTASVKAPVSKLGREQIKRYRASLVKVRAAYEALEPPIRVWFSLAGVGYVAGGPTVVSREIARSDLFLQQPSPEGRKDATKQAEAAQQAWLLLMWRGMKTVTTTGGDWDRLSRILNGEKTVRMTEHLREFKKALAEHASRANK
jgi:hypothetical protein